MPAAHVGKAVNRPVRDLQRAIDNARALLENEARPIVRGAAALQITDILRHAAEDFGWVRTEAFCELREQYDYSLADLASEFGITRARAAQIAVRERYKEQRKERREAKAAVTAKAAKALAAKKASAR